MEEKKYYNALIQILVANSIKKPPQNLTRDICDGIRYALSTLEPRETECLEQHIGLGVTYAELARRWEIGADTVRHIEGKALRKLRETSRWNYIQFGVVGALQEAKAVSEKNGFRKGYRAGYQDGLEDGRLGKEEADPDEELMNCPIAYLDISIRALHCLAAYGCERIQDVVQLSEEQIAIMRNLGKITADEMARALNRNGIAKTAWDRFML